MRKKIFLAALGALLLAAMPAWSVPACWMIGQGDCNVSCYVAGYGDCNSWSVGPCNGNSAPYTYYCSSGTINGYCSACGGGGGGCFLAGTEITMADGSTKIIESIQAGDVILAYDEATGEMKPDQVREVHDPIEAEYYLVVNRNLRLTPTHPMLSGSEWVEIGQLKVGDALTAMDGSTVTIDSIEIVQEKVTVYNFAVNPYGTYVADGIIVHNKKVPAEPAEPDTP